MSETENLTFTTDEYNIVRKKDTAGIPPEIVVDGTKEKPYFNIRYFDAEKGYFCIGYSSYELAFVFGWLKEYFGVDRAKVADPEELRPKEILCQNCRNKDGSLFDALASIVWYDGHYEWLKLLSEELRKCVPNEFYHFEVDSWHTEQHTIWMLLVGMFGDWGVSIRSGWIEKTAECADFIDALCRDCEEGEKTNE